MSLPVGDLDIEFARSWNAASVAELSAMMEEAATAYEHARELYEKCLEDLEQHQARMEKVRRSWASRPPTENAGNPLSTSD
jgi:hypothetical protein